MSIPQLANLQIKKLIVHQVFKRDETRTLVAPRYSNDFTELDEAGKATLQVRVTEALGNDSYCIEMAIDKDGVGSTYDLCNQMIDADDLRGFKKASQELAAKLASAQLTRRIPGGILVVFSGTIGPENSKYIGIIKAELHEGFSLQEKRQKLLIEFISNLLLTPQQKLYKIAMLILRNSSPPQSRTPEDYDVLVYDHNMTKAETRQAASYFYEGFLGCTFSPSARKLTSDFYNHTRDFVNALDYSNEEIVDLKTSLYTYLKVAQTNVVDAAEYANNYFPSEIRDNYFDYLQSKNFPLNAIPKDITYLKYKLQRRNLKFSSDVKINAPAERFSELVQIKSSDSEKTTVIIQGTLERED